MPPRKLVRSVSNVRVTNVSGALQLVQILVVPLRLHTRCAYSFPGPDQLFVQIPITFNFGFSPTPMGP